MTIGRVRRKPRYRLGSERRDRRSTTIRQPRRVNPRKTVATITNGVAVPRLNAVLRKTIPTARVAAHTTAPKRTPKGRGSTRTAANHPTPRARRNGAATLATPRSAFPSLWLLRPTTTNSSIDATSANPARRTSDLLREMGNGIPLTLRDNPWKQERPELIEERDGLFQVSRVARIGDRVEARVFSDRRCEASAEPGEFRVE